MFWQPLGYYYSRTQSLRGLGLSRLSLSRLVERDPSTACLRGHCRPRLYGTEIQMALLFSCLALLQCKTTL